MDNILIHTKSRDGLYEAKGLFTQNSVTVFKGSRINIHPGGKYAPSKTIMKLLDSKNIISAEGILLEDCEFPTLSTAATFVTGRIANGLMVWKTEDGRYIRYTINPNWIGRK